MFVCRLTKTADNGEANAAGLNGARFSVIFGGLRVDAGNVAGSFDNLANYYGNEVVWNCSQVSTRVLTTASWRYSSTGSGANAVFFQYAVGDFAFGASYDQQPLASTASNGTDDADRWDVSATYTFNNITAALAYGQTENPVGGTTSQA